MKHVSALSLALGTAFSFGGHALAQNAQLPIISEPGAVQSQHHPTHPVTVPSSSLWQVEDIGKRLHTNSRFISPKALSDNAGGAKALVGPPFAGYGYETPGSLACLYGLVAITSGCNPNSATTVSTKGSRAIAIVDAYHYATALPDLRTYSTQFGLPAPRLTVLYATSAGACNGPQPAFDPGWEGEEALDLQMAHAMAPKAALYLVEAQSNLTSDLLGAVKCANSRLEADGGGELSMSWGGDEFSTETSYDTYFSAPNVVYFAAAGDSPGVIWPSVSTKVVAAGGMSNSRTTNFNFQYYATWSDGGGGVSAYVARPTYQNSIAGAVGNHRGIPDIAADADPYTGVWVYDSNPYYGIGWYIYGGTSVASPLLTGLTNAAGTFRANTAAELTAIYAAKSTSQTLQFAPAATGYCGIYAAFSAVPQWNFCVGVGAPKGPGITPLTAQR